MSDSFDEMLGRSNAEDATGLSGANVDYGRWLESEDPARIHKKALQAEAFFRRTGITFNVYGSDAADERRYQFCQCGQTFVRVV